MHICRTLPPPSSEKPICPWFGVHIGTNKNLKKYCPIVCVLDCLQDLSWLSKLHQPFLYLVLCSAHPPPTTLLSSIATGNHQIQSLITIIITHSSHIELITHGCMFKCVLLNVCFCLLQSFTMHTFANPMLAHGCSHCDL